MAALCIQGAAFLVPYSRASRLIVITLGPVPEDRTVDDIDLAERLVLEGLLRQFDRQIVPILPDDHQADFVHRCCLVHR